MDAGPDTQDKPLSTSSKADPSTPLDPIAEEEKKAILKVINNNCRKERERRKKTVEKLSIVFIGSNKDVGDINTVF